MDPSVSGPHRPLGTRCTHRARSDETLDPARASPAPALQGASGGRAGLSVGPWLPALPAEGGPGERGEAATLDMAGRAGGDPSPSHIILSRAKSLLMISSRGGDKNVEEQSFSKRFSLALEQLFARCAGATRCLLALHTRPDPRGARRGASGRPAAARRRCGTGGGELCVAAAPAAVRPLRPLPGPPNAVSC